MTIPTHDHDDADDRPAWTADRRTLLRAGLGAFATAMMSRALQGCGSDPAPGGQTPDGGQADGGLVDATGTDVADATPGADAVAVTDGGAEFPMRAVPAAPRLRSRIADIGPLGAPDANGVRLPSGFRARVIARSGEAVAGTAYTWHSAPDGGATFRTEDGGWIYVSNSELPLLGGVGAVRFERDGRVRAAYRILDRTNINCAGGLTPWHTWLSCEESSRGRVFECDPWGERPAVARLALGVFKHEAAAIDPVRGHVYLTEDESDGRLYRFVPDARTAEGFPVLRAGRLEVASVAMDGAVTWLPVPDPRFMGSTPTLMQVADSTRFSGGEGIWYHEDRVYFATKGDDRVWSYDVTAARLRVIYHRAMSMTPVLRGVDNLTVSCCGDVIVAEDGGSMQLVVILPSGEARVIAQVMGQSESEIAGPAFDPSGTRLYFSSQRGTNGAGITYEIEGPFHEPAA